MSGKGRKPSYRRYHYQVYFPENIGEMVADFYQQCRDGNPGVTYHAADEAILDKREKIPLPTTEQLFHSENTLVEVYEIMENRNPTGLLQKMLIRVPNLSPDYDFSYVIARENFIVSCWANDKNDIHRLTDEIKYFKP